MRNLDLEKLINTELNTVAFQDYGPNGLQVEGRPHVQRIVTGVTACQALLDAAVEHQADAVVVHHGYFGKTRRPRYVA
jgi:putative NIF3 family GTP cyclohydrolase 1 type 2